MKEETLSDKIVLCYVEFGKSDTNFRNIKCAGDMIHKDYIKQFIKKILNKPERITYKKWIKQNAGKELIE